MTHPWRDAADYIVGLGRVRLRKPGEMIQPQADREFLRQHAEEIARRIIDLGLVDGVVGVARPLSADNLIDLGMTGLAPITIDAILPDFYTLHSVGFRDMQAFGRLLDRLVLQLRLLPSLPDTPQALRELQRTLFTADEQRAWRGNGFHLREPGERLYRERMQAAGYDLDAAPWVLDSFDWELDAGMLDILARYAIDESGDDEMLSAPSNGGRSQTLRDPTKDEPC